MNPLKPILRKLILSAGYDIRKRSHIGLDAHSDIQQIFGRKPLRTIMDVGAHLGESAMEYAARFPQATIFCFEPTPETFVALSNNVSGCARIKPVQSAVGAKCHEQAFFVNKFSATNSLLPVTSNPAHSDVRSLMENVERVDVSVTTLESFCAANHIDAIDLLKLDVQGFESAVLTGSARMLEEESIALIYTEVTFETHYEGQTTFPELYARLSDSGFQLVDTYGQTRTIHQAMRWCDMLFLHSRALEKALG